jgi:shikimate kinase
MKIFLIGFMGSGKTTLGRKLAARMNYEFIDLDHKLEQQVELSIAEYFSFFGEDSFRKLERKCCAKLFIPRMWSSPQAAGCLAYFDNIEWMKANGKVVYINLSPKTLADRLESRQGRAPAFAGQTRRGPGSLYRKETGREREPFYSQANIIADGLSLTAERLEQILMRISNL